MNVINKRVGKILHCTRDCRNWTGGMKTSGLHEGNVAARRGRHVEEGRSLGRSVGGVVKSRGLLD
jgi:hypothetical protein